jgi:iron complex transport system substrate-binding protein
VRFEEPPDRLLPANASALDLVAVLVGPERLCAVPETAGGYASVRVDEEPWRSLPELVQYRAEEVLALEPELVIVHAWQDPETTRLLRRAGVPVVELPDVFEVEVLLAVVRSLGGILHADERAAALAAEIEARCERLAARAPNVAPRAMYYSNYGTGGWTAGAGTAEDLVMRLAGLRNAAAEAGITKHGQIDLERLLALDPDVMIVCALGEDSELSTTRTYLGSEPVLRGLRAVRDERILLLPVRLYSSTSHHMLAAAEELADQLARLPAPATSPASPDPPR